MTQSSKLTIGRRRANAYETQSKVARPSHAHYSSLLENPVPSELRNLVVQLLAIEARKHHSTAGAIDVLQLAAAPIGRNSNKTGRVP